MSDIEIHHLGAAYALDALDERERLAFEAHYSTCEICRTDVHEFRVAAADLGRLTTAPPPDALRARVLADIATTRQLSPVPGAVVRLADRRRSRPVMMAASIAAAVLCFAVGAWIAGGFAGDDVGDEVAALLAEPGVRVAELSGDGGGTIRVVWSGDRAAIVGSALPEAPAGRAYELWLIGADGRPLPMGLLDPADGGALTGVVALDADAVPSAWGVTIEDDGGATVPSEPILYAATVTA
jgi:anti-sigma-K factor RskA